MIVAFDIDGTIDANPAAMQSLMMALKTAGHRVAILTGSSMDKVTPDEIDRKREYLNSLGVGECYDDLAVFPSPPHKAKAKWCKKHNVSILVDNNAKNATLASNYCTVLVPWSTLIPAKGGPDG